MVLLIRIEERRKTADCKQCHVVINNMMRRIGYEEKLLFYKQKTIKFVPWRWRQALGIFDVNAAPLVSSEQDSLQVPSYDVNTTSVNETGPVREVRNNMSNQQINKLLEANGCKEYSVDKNGNVIKSSSVTTEASRHAQIQTKMEDVLLCISIGSIIIYIIVLSVLRIKITEKIFVHVNLELSWGLGILVYVLDRTLFTDRMELPVICSIVAVTQHYLHTALFTWMLVEGINLYNKLVKVFSVKKQYLAFTAVGWGIPAIIVGSVAAIKPSSYDMGAPLVKDVMCGSLKFTGELKRTRCWFNGSLWIYKGPVLFFLLVNFGLFVILLRVIFGKLAQKYSQENITLARKGFRSIAALLPLLGVTQLLGFFIEFHTALVYLFILLNSTQGLLFTIFHCIFDDQIREGLKKLCAKNHATQKTNKKAMDPLNTLQTPDKSHHKSATLVVMEGRIDEDGMYEMQV